MRTDTTTTLESIDSGGEYHLGSYGVPRLGVDRDGRGHYFDEANDRVLVARDGDVIHVQPLNGRPVVDWVAFVAERSCGWRTHGSSQMLDALAGAI